MPSHANVLSMYSAQSLHPLHTITPPPPHNHSIPTCSMCTITPPPPHNHSTHSTQSLHPHMLHVHNHSTHSTQSLHPLHTYTPLGPDTASRVFSSTLVRNSQPTIPGRSKEKEGAIFVLTCGRGLIDLRSGIKTNVLFPTARTSSVSQETKGCMLAYELEQ